MRRKILEDVQIVLGLIGIGLTVAAVVFGCWFVSYLPLIAALIVAGFVLHWLGVFG